MTGSLSDDRIPPRSNAWDKWGWLAAMGAFLAWSFSVAGGEILAVFTREGVAQFGSYLKNFWPPATDAAFLSVVAKAVPVIVRLPGRESILVDDPVAIVVYPVA